MKKLLLSLIILLSACAAEPFEESDIIIEETPTTPYILTQTYKSSTLNHEWNSGYFNELTMNWEHAFRRAFTYVDFDKDGDMDIFAEVDDYVTEGAVQWNTLYILENLGNNEWKSNLDVIPIQTGVFYRRLDAADIDNDGDIDIVGFVAQEPVYGDYYPRVGGVDLYRNENGVFVYENIVPYEENWEIWFHGGALADVNGDGWVDIVGSASIPRIYLNKGEGEFDYNDWFEVGKKWGDGGINWGGVHIWNVHFADLNNDGLLDMIGGINKNTDKFFNFEDNNIEKFNRNFEIYYNTGVYPYFDTNPYYLGTDYYSDDIEEVFTDANDIAVIDYNNDGYVDIFTVESKSWRYSYDGVYQYHQNNGDGTFTIKNDIFGEKENEVFGSEEGGQVWNIKAWDIDNDNEIELLIENWKYTGFNIWDKKTDGKLKKSTY